MLRRLFRAKKSTRPSTDRRKSHRSSFGQFESLERRECPAFTFTSNILTQTLTFNQTANNGNAVLDDQGFLNSFQITDGSGTNNPILLFPVTTVIVNMLSNTGNQLNYDQDVAYTGSVVLNLNNGNRTVNFTGTNNAPGGNVTISGGTGNQTVNLSTNTMLNVGTGPAGNLNINLGAGTDVVSDNGNGLNIGNNGDFDGVNNFTYTGALTVGNDFDIGWPIPP